MSAGIELTCFDVGVAANVIEADVEARLERSDFIERLRGFVSQESKAFSTPLSTTCKGMPISFQLSIRAQSIELSRRCLARRRTKVSSISVK